MDTLADQYYLKAMDSYPYDLEVAVENLNYALSYDHEHIGANCLMGRLYREQLIDYSRAESHYLVALANDPRDVKVCLDYILLLLSMREASKARDLLAYVKTFNVVDLAGEYYCEGLMYEYDHKYDQAIRLYEQAVLETYNDETTAYLNGEIKRVKAKLKLKKSSNRYK